MSNLTKFIVVISLAVLFSGCSIRHVISTDYPRFLSNHEGTAKFPQTDYEAEYLLTPNTVNHNYEFRAATVGYAHLWVVKFGEMLETSLQSKDVQSAFRRLSKSRNEGSFGILTIKYNLVDYKFEGFEARVKLQISVLKENSVIFNSTYFEKGTSQGAKMFFFGPFAMKNNIQVSTKNAIDKILIKSLQDMMSKNVR